MHNQMATDTPQRKKYDSTLLSECILRDNAKLVGEYPSPIVTTRIRFICHCGKEDCKMLRFVADNGGFFCKSCVILRTKEKVKVTYKALTGYECPLSNPELRAKEQEARFNRRGVYHSSQGLDEAETQKRNNTRRKTCQERFKYDNPAQDPSILAKIKNSSFHSVKDYILPSGNTITIQGYEPYAVPDLLKITTEEDLLTGEKFGQIAYPFKGSIHQYTCDFYIKSINKIIEIKCKWTLALEPDKIRAKAEACKALGYAYEIWVYNSKGEKIDTIVY